MEGPNLAPLVPNSSHQPNPNPESLHARLLGAPEKTSTQSHLPYAHTNRAPIAPNSGACTYASLLKPSNTQSSPRTKKKSFSQMIADGPNEGSINLKVPCSYKGDPALSFSNEEIDLLAQDYKYALIGKFSKRFPKYKLIKPALLKMGFKSCFTVGALRPGFILINFELEEDFNRLWMKPEWLVPGWPMRVFKWTPHFNFQAESSFAAVWVTFPELPVHFFNKRVLYSLANLIGKPIKVDEPTADRTRPSRARVCIEIDLTRDYGSRVWLECGSGGWLPQSFHFENLPPYCRTCSKRGHSDEKCRLNVQSGKGKESEIDEGRVMDKLRKLSQQRLQGKTDRTHLPPLLGLKNRRKDPAT